MHHLYEILLWGVASIAAVCLLLLMLGFVSTSGGPR